jgi:hypothetical protein
MQVYIAKTFHGFGAGLFIAPLLEYRPADSRWGVMLQAGYDSKGDFDQVITACDCPLSTNKLHYSGTKFTFCSFKSNFIYMVVHVWLSWMINFTYQLGINPAYPDQEATPAVKVILIKSKNNYFNANWSRI